MKKKVLFLLLIVLLASCYRLNSGTIINKEFVPEHTQTYVSFIYTGKTSMPVVRTRRVPDSWYITIEGEIKGKTRKKNIYVSKDEYDSVNIGDFIRIK